MAVTQFCRIFILITALFVRDVILQTSYKPITCPAQSRVEDALQPNGINMDHDGGKIINGVNCSATNYNVNYQVYLLTTINNGENEELCGGSLLSLTSSPTPSNYILTAAHCVFGAADNNTLGLGLTFSKCLSQKCIKVFAGTSLFNWDTAPVGSIQRFASGITVHPLFNIGTLLNDIAIIELDSPIPLGDRTAAVKLPSASDDIQNTQQCTHALISGFGVTNENATDVPYFLKCTDVVVVSNVNCNLAYLSQKIAILPTQMCSTGFYKTSNGVNATCFGDSGGPLVIDGKQYGITSFAVGCGEPLYPDVYTRVSSYLLWIYSIIYASSLPALPISPIIPHGLQNIVG